MKIRKAFVSNSSSCSFLIEPSNNINHKNLESLLRHFFLSGKLSFYINQDLNMKLSKSNQVLFSLMAEIFPKLVKNEYIHENDIPVEKHKFMINLCHIFPISVLIFVGMDDDPWSILDHHKEMRQFGIDYQPVGDGAMDETQCNDAIDSIMSEEYTIISEPF